MVAGMPEGSAWVGVEGDSYGFGEGSAAAVGKAFTGSPEGEGDTGGEGDADDGSCPESSPFERVGESRLRACGAYVLGTVRNEPLLLSLLIPLPLAVLFGTGWRDAGRRDRDGGSKYR
ncbi:hypothetical protein QFC19_008053 [Naganishia cerealis]|uniref:Uncharacterized protein n=1 Tax=Naganishia cerealis TaxID=610337 RepID=A0ACC2V5S7_9TREE|nr:hypothetical protein QFC19_008053 [Naganishia cerealis]